jgi:DNA-binding CsgD family transcriptional regulator
MYLQTGRPEEALALVAGQPRGRIVPSMNGEYVATRALVLAALGQQSAALADCGEATAMTSAVEARGYADAARNLVRFRAGDPTSVIDAFRHAESTTAWDPLLTMLRAAPDFAVAAAQVEPSRDALRALCERIGDRALARQADVKIRTPASTIDDQLSPREREVLGLIAQGLKNSEIAGTLFVSESTVKVHVRHILEKLNVKTRAAAIARVSSQ